MKLNDFDKAEEKEKKHLLIVIMIRFMMVK